MFDKSQKEFMKDSGKIVKINETSTNVTTTNATSGEVVPSGGGSSSGGSSVPYIPSNETAPSGGGSSVPVIPEPSGNETAPSSSQNYTYVDYYDWMEYFDWSSCGVPMRRSCGQCSYYDDYYGGGC